MGARVAHPEWGPGTVQRTEDDMLTVVFDGVGYKTLALEVVEENGLLEPVDGAGRARTRRGPLARRSAGPGAGRR